MSAVAFTIVPAARQRLIELLLSVFPFNGEGLHARASRRVIRQNMEQLLKQEWQLGDMGFLLLQIGELLGKLSQYFGVDIQEGDRRRLYDQLKEWLLV